MIMSKLITQTPFFIVLELSRRVFPEKMRPELEKLVPQHPFDAHGLRNCKSRARIFSLTAMKSFMSENPNF